MKALITLFVSFALFSVSGYGKAPSAWTKLEQNALHFQTLLADLPALAGLQGEMDPVLSAIRDYRLGQKDLSRVREAFFVAERAVQSSMAEVRAELLPDSYRARVFEHIRQDWRQVKFAFEDMQA